MKLMLNGEPVETDTPNLLSFLGAQGVDPEQRGVAVAINSAVVLRAEWDRRELRDGDDVEVITAMQGG